MRAPSKEFLIVTGIFLLMFLAILLIFGCGSAQAAKSFLMPEDFGAVSKNKKISELGWSQNKIDRRWPDVGATPDDQIDWAANQRCVDVCGTSGKLMRFGRDKYYLNRTITYDIYYHLDIEGPGTQWIASHSGIFTMFGARSQATSQLDAEHRFSNTDISIKGIVWKGQNQLQTAIHLSNVKFTYLHKNDISDMKQGMILDFCMYGYVLQNNFTGCKNGIRSGVSYGYPASMEVSSNLLTVTLNHFHTCSDTAMANFGAYNNYFINNSVEGNGTCKIGLYENHKDKTTANNITIDGVHFEQKGGAEIAWIKLEGRHQLYIIRNVSAHYPGILVDAQMTSTNGGGMKVVLEGVLWAVPKNGKLLRSKAVQWRFPYSTAIVDKGTVGPIWATDMGGSEACEGNGCGWNSYETGFTQF